MHKVIHLKRLSFLSYRLVSLSSRKFHPQNQAVKVRIYFRACRRVSSKVFWEEFWVCFDGKVCQSFQSGLPCPGFSHTRIWVSWPTYFSSLVLWPIKLITMHVLSERKQPWERWWSNSKVMDMLKLAIDHFSHSSCPDQGSSIPSFLLSIANEYSRTSGGLFAQILSGNERFDVRPTCQPPLLLNLPCSGFTNTSI